jgi:nitrogen fixation negative regulator NifL
MKSSNPPVKSIGTPDVATQVFERVVEQADLAVSITDPKANIVYVNPAFTRITGYTPEQAIGKNESMLSHKVTPPEVYQSLWGKLAARESWNGRLVNRRADGGKYLAELVISPVLDAQGQVIHFLGLHRDVTDLHRLESEVKNQKALIESVVDAAPVAMALLDGEDSVLLDNHEYKKLMGDLAMAEPATAILDAVRADLGHGLGSPKPGMHAFLNQEVRIDPPNNRPARWFSCSGIWVRRDEVEADSFFDQQNSIYLLLVAMEITELRAQQEKSRMAVLKAMLAEEDRINSLRESLAGAAFQLEGPMNVMSTVLATMDRRRESPTATDALRSALAAAREAIATLRAAIPAESEEVPTTVNLNEVLHEVLNLSTGRMLAAGVRVGWQPQSVLPAVHGYPNRLRAMLKALVDNAIEAMNVRGWHERDLSVASRSIDGGIEILIEDTGPGVPVGARLKVFEPFYTTKKNGGHLGTGLSSALQVVQDHGGAIEVDPADGGGCRVRVVLPLKTS